MQNRIRKGRSFKGDRRARISALACFSALIFSGCSHFKKQSTLTSATPLGQICLSGDGRARITTESRRSVASYESLFDMDKGKFLFNIEIPGKGDELLEVFLPDDQHSVARARGSFLKNLEVKNQKDIQQFVAKLGTVLTIYRGTELDRRGIECQASDNSGLCKKDQAALLTWRVENEKLDILLPGKNHIFNVTGENLSDGHFKKVTLEFRDEAKHQSKIKVELFLTSCK